MKKIFLSLITIIASVASVSATSLSEIFDSCAEVPSIMKMDLPLDLISDTEGIRSGKMAMFDLSKADTIYAITAEIPKEYVMASVNQEEVDVDIYCQPHEDESLVNLLICVKGEDDEPQLIVVFLTCEKDKLDDSIKLVNQ